MPSKFVAALIEALRDKGFQHEAKSERFTRLQPIFLGIRQSLIDINAFAIFEADGLSKEDIEVVHNQFFEYLSAWRPAFFLARALKKTGVACFVFERGSTHETLDWVRQQNDDIDTKQFVLTDSARTASWAVDLRGSETTHGFQLLLPMFPPAAAYFYPGSEWLRKFVENYLNTEKPVIYFVFSGQDAAWANEIKASLESNDMEVIRYDERVRGGTLTNRYHEWSKECWHILFLVSNAWGNLSPYLVEELNIIESYKAKRADEFVYMITKDRLDTSAHSHIADRFGVASTYNEANVQRLIAHFKEKPRFK